MGIGLLSRVRASGYGVPDLWILVDDDSDIIRNLYRPEINSACSAADEWL